MRCLGDHTGANRADSRFITTRLLRPRLSRRATPYTSPSPPPDAKALSPRNNRSKRPTPRTSPSLQTQISTAIVEFRGITKGPPVAKRPNAPGPAEPTTNSSPQPHSSPSTAPAKPGHPTPTAESQAEKEGRHDHPQYPRSHHSTPRPSRSPSPANPSSLYPPHKATLLDGPQPRAPKYSKKARHPAASIWSNARVLKYPPSSPATRSESQSQRWPYSAINAHFVRPIPIRHHLR